MSKQNNNIDDKLSLLYKNHKSDNKLTQHQKSKLINLIFKANQKNKVNWLYTFQISLAAVALFTLFGLLFNQRYYQNNAENIVYIPTNSIIEVHYLDKNMYHKEIKHSDKKTKSQLARQLANKQFTESKSRLESYNQLKGRLINKADDWYIESCNKQVLVQVNASLLQQLQRHNALDNTIKQGDLLAFKHNANGEIIALLKIDNHQQCKA